MADENGKSEKDRLKERLADAAARAESFSRATQRFPEGSGSKVLTPEERRARMTPAEEETRDEWLDDSRVTQRLPEEPPEPAMEDRATDRFQMEPLTGQTTGREEGGTPGTLTPGELVDDRYRVEQGPIGARTGEAEVYRGTDTQTGEAVALKLYREGLAPKGSVMDSLLNIHHPCIITLKAFGKWAGRFYEIMDYCAGGSLMEHMPLDEETLRGLLERLVSGLQYLHSENIVHRDIKPNNLFFRSVDKDELVIGDFGVSSYLEDDEQVRRTATADFFTLDYAAPELIDGKEISAKTDYYALGITLLHLLEGSSPFSGMDKNSILGSHFRGTVPRPGNLSPQFRALVNGLLRVEPTRRWGYRQVMNWLRGEPIKTDDGVPDHEEAFAGKRVPYRSCPTITTPSEMAGRLHEFEALKDLQRGFVSQWAMFFSIDLGQEVAILEEEYSRDPGPDRGSLCLFRLRYMLDPTQPLEVGDRRAYNVADLAGIIALPHSPYELELENLLYSGSIEIWIRSMQTGGQALDLAKRVGGIRERITNRPLGVFALLYTIDPAQPLRLSDKIAARSPEEIEEALASHPELSLRVSQYLFTGYLEEWFRLAFPERPGELEFLRDCVRRHENNRELGLFAFRCRLRPDLPLRIGTESVSSPRDFARLIARSPQDFERGARLLSEGWIRAWLLNTGRLKDAEAFDAIANDFTLSLPRKMEAILHVLDPATPWPTPAADVEAIDEGAITTDFEKTVRVTIFNAGRGHLSGTITLMEDASERGSSSGISMVPRELEGGPLEVQVELTGRGLAVGAQPRAVLVADTNGGRLQIPITFRVTAPMKWILARTLAAAILTAEVFGLIRLLIETLMPEYKLTVMNWIGRDEAATRPDLWLFLPLGFLLSCALTGGTYYLVSMLRARE